MAARVAWTESAIFDLDAAAGYIARDSPRYAASLVREIRNRTRGLREFPLKGRIVPEFEDESLRELIVGSYRVIYSYDGEDVFVLAVIHGARDLPEVWAEERRGPDQIEQPE